mgnify:CR=1 FL=1
MNTHFVKFSVIILFFALLCSPMSARVEASETEPEALTPLTDFGELRAEDMEANYYGLVVDWTRRLSLNNNLQVEVLYLDPRLVLASEVLAGTVAEDTFDDYVAEQAAAYAASTPFIIKLSHDTNIDRLNLGDWKVTLANDQGEEQVLTDYQGSEPQLRTSYSRGNFYQVDYDVSFPTSGYQFLDSSTKWMKLSFDNGRNVYEITWDFQPQVSAQQSNVFETVMKILITSVTVLLALGLIVTRPKVSVLNEWSRADR